MGEVHPVVCASVLGSFSKVLEEFGMRFLGFLGDENLLHFRLVSLELAATNEENSVDVDFWNLVRDF